MSQSASTLHGLSTAANVNKNKSQGAKMADSKSEAQPEWTAEWNLRHLCINECLQTSLNWNVKKTRPKRTQNANYVLHTLLRKTRGISEARENTGRARYRARTEATSQNPSNNYYHSFFFPQLPTGMSSDKIKFSKGLLKLLFQCTILPEWDLCFKKV